MTDAAASDAIWVKRARAGSDAAFGRLVDAHGQAVRNFLRRICPNPDEADDLAQEAFLTAWMALRRLKDPARFRTWVMGIAWRKAKTRARSALRGRRRETSWQLEQESDEIAPHPDKTLALKQAMAQLSTDQRAAVALCLGAGASHPEAAEALGMPLGTVKSHVTRGRARLAQILGVDDVEGKSDD